MNRGAWWAIVHRVVKSWTRLRQLNMHVHILYKNNRNTGILHTLDNDSKEFHIYVYNDYFLKFPIFSLMKFIPLKKSLQFNMFKY